MKDNNINEMASITDEEFDKALLDLIDDSSPSTILAVSGVYEALSEEWNNAILEIALVNRTLSERE